MNNKKKQIKFSNIPDNLAKKYIVQKSIKYSETLFEHEKKQRQKRIKQIKNKTIFIAGLYGVIGVLLLYLPQYIFPEIFNKVEYSIPFTKFNFAISLTEMIYGFFLVIIEIYLLTINDLNAISKITAIYGYSAKNDDFNANEFVLIGLGKDKKVFTKIGINPYQNFSKVSVLLIRVLFIFKALLSNFIFKILIKKVLGRLGIRAIVDLAGIPIYAIWNAYASSIVIRKTIMRMQAQVEMERVGQHFLQKFKNNDSLKKLIYDTFSYIAISKKNFYPTDYVFVRHILKTLNIPIKKEHILSNNYIEDVKKLPSDVKLATGQMLILGFLLDGKIGRFEIIILKKLRKNNIIPYSIKEIKKWTNDYKIGNGFDEMFSK